MNPNTLLQDISVGKTVTAAWVLFTSLFFLYSISYPVLEKSKLDAVSQSAYTNGYNTAANQAMASFSGNTLQNGYNNGYGTAVLQLTQALAKQYEGGCTEAVPVTVGSGSIGVVSIDCLQKAAAGSASGKTAPVQK